MRSENGVLNATLRAAAGRVQLGDYAFPGLLYNDSYLPPLLRVQLGDTLRSPSGMRLRMILQTCITTA